MKLKCLVLTILAAGCTFLAIPNEIFLYGNPLFGSFCLVPFFLAVYLSPTRRYASLMGLLFGVLTTLFSYYWLAYFQEFSVWTITGTTLGYALYYTVLAPFLFRFKEAPAAYRPLLLAAAFTVFEYFKAMGYLGFPWGLMAYPFVNLTPFLQIADITGVWGVSFLVLLFQATLTESVYGGVYLQTVRRGHVGILRRTAAQRLRFIRAPGTFTAQAVVVVSLIALALIYGHYRMGTDIQVTKNARILMVQQNIDSWVGGNEVESLIRGQRLTREGIRQSDEPVDLVLWSETSFRRPYLEYREFYETRPAGDPFVSFVREIGAPFLVGSPYLLEDDGALNAVILVGPDGEIREHYGKQHPVPLAEHVPFWEIESVRKFFQDVIGLYSAGWTVGNRYTLFTVPLRGSGETLTFGAPICFEDAFPYINRRFVKRGAEILVNLTNDSWSRQDSAQTQHYAAALFRSVETKRTMVRSTNSGVTAVIDPYGRKMAELPFFEEAVLVYDVPIYEEERLTPYTLFGDYFPYGLMILLTGTLIGMRIRRR
ncbi:MAG: apolipoprotein N-acyltransferase [Spirochaetia bacterium]